MALLDDRTAQAQLAKGRAAAEAAVSQVAATRASLGVLRQEVPDAIASADAGIAVAHANLHQVQGVAVQAGLDSARAQTLLQSHLIDTQAAQRSALAWRIAQEQQAAAVADIRKAEQALRDARAAQSRHGDVAAGYSARLF
jgi:multidrug resistance efflux pump